MWQAGHALIFIILALRQAWAWENVAVVGAQMTTVLSRGEFEPWIAPWPARPSGRWWVGGCDLLAVCLLRDVGKPQRLPQSSVDDGIKVASHTERSWTLVRRS